MKTNIYREKLLHAILFFARNTKYVNMTKLSKLLYFLDFDHFKQTGYPCIGLEYYAFEKGPVPKDFWLEVRDGDVPDDFRGKLAIVPKKDDTNKTFRELEFRAIVAPDLSVFTPREKKLLEKIAFVFRDARAWEISEISHLPRQPWDITMKERGKNCPIDYLLAIDKESGAELEESKQSLKEYFEAMHNFGLEPTRRD